MAKGEEGMLNKKSPAHRRGKREIERLTHVGAKIIGALWELKNKKPKHSRLFVFTIRLQV